MRESVGEEFVRVEGRPFFLKVGDSRYIYAQTGAVKLIRKCGRRFSFAIIRFQDYF